MKKAITFPFTKHGTGALEKDHSCPPAKKKWILDSKCFTQLSVVINVLYCIVMYCQWQLEEVSSMRHLWRAIFKKLAMTAWCVLDISNVGGMQH